MGLKTFSELIVLFYIENRVSVWCRKSSYGSNVISFSRRKTAPHTIDFVVNPILSAVFLVFTRVANFFCLSVYLGPDFKVWVVFIF